MGFERPTDDSTLVVKINQSFTIRLRSEPSQGYSWKLVDSSSTLLKQNQKETFEQPSSSIPGNGGTQVFYFKALKSGNGTIRFIYVRPFEKPYPKNAPKKVFHVVIQ